MSTTLDFQWVLKCEFLDFGHFCQNNQMVFIVVIACWYHAKDSYSYQL